MHLVALERVEADAECIRGLLRLTVDTKPPTVVALPPVRGSRCCEPRCPMGVWSEQHQALPTRAKLTTRAVEWAIQTLRWDYSTVSALARQLGVDWHTLMNAIRARATDHLDDEPTRTARLGRGRHPRRR
ncbi:helix-turn-helix domain-containing protein [Kineococcus sp. TBRC 1896]|uniref:Helix-turn-helix domain-containing protein n=1 Tax=Kineococcus mangrovi TaxID=1660183 RepID=A0ABV4I1Z7_9ACTN